MSNPLPYVFPFQEIIQKDEEIGSIRVSLKEASEGLEAKTKEARGLAAEVEQLKAAQATLEKSLESDKASALQGRKDSRRGRKVFLDKTPRKARLDQNLTRTSCLSLIK